MFDIAQLAPAHFASLVGRSMMIVGSEHILQIESVTPLASPSPRAEPFSLVLRSMPGLTGPQGNYTLQHPELGDITIFLVPIEPQKGCARFEAVFN